jgi:hypothetical protein
MARQLTFSDSTDQRTLIQRAAAATDDGTHDDFSYKKDEDDAMPADGTKVLIACLPYTLTDHLSYVV